MNRLCFLIIFVIVQIHSLCQNLVTNGDFEAIDSCLQNNSSVDSYQRSMNSFCKGWFDKAGASESVDFYNSCNCSPFNIASNNLGGFIGVSGSSYIGFTCYSGVSSSGNLIDIREVASTKLNESLKLDSTYCISFSYNNVDLHGNFYSLNNIGVLMSMDTLDYIRIRTLPPSFKVASISPGEGWKKVDYEFVADSNYNFLNIGSFGLDSEIQCIFNSYNYLDSWPLAYFIFDDIKVVKGGCSIDVSDLLKVPNVFTPNNDGVNDRYLILPDGYLILKAQIFNRWGQIVYESDSGLVNWGGEWKGENVSSGVYYLILNFELNGSRFTKQYFLSLVR